jgi:hypothetical protein
VIEGVAAAAPRAQTAFFSLRSYRSVIPRCIWKSISLLLTAPMNDRFAVDLVLTVVHPQGLSVTRLSKTPDGQVSIPVEFTYVNQ